MSVLVDKNSRVIVQGGTGAYGAAQVQWMVAGGTPIVGFVSPGRGGSRIDGLPVFDLVADAVAETGADCSIVYLPAPGARDAIVENADAGIRLCVVAAELVPIHDTLVAGAHARAKGMWLVGPNSLGVATPGQCVIGSVPVDFTRPGPVGVLSRSGTMGLTVTRLLTRAGCGQSTFAHMGGDPVVGRTSREYLELLLDDPETGLVAYVAEIGGAKEYEMLDLIAGATKPVVALIVGRHAPAGKQMGHAGALIGDGRETAAAKGAALAEAGAVVVTGAREMAETVARLLGVDSGVEAAAG